MDLDQNRFETFDELYLYCYRVAGTVGLMMMPIMGTAEGYTYEEAWWNPRWRSAWRCS